MNPLHLVWLLPGVMAVSALVTLDVYRWHRRRQYAALVRQERRQEIERNQHIVTRLPAGFERHPAIAHHFDEWERELSQ